MAVIREDPPQVSKVALRVRTFTCRLCCFGQKIDSHRDS